MSLITYTELCKLVEDDVLCVSRLNPKPFDTIPLDNINGASIDVRLGCVFLREQVTGGYPAFVRLKNKDELKFLRQDVTWGDEVLLEPGEFILAHTVEIFNLPNYIGAEFRLKSSVARAGLDQALAVWCDPGWNSSVLTIELRNNTRYHVLVLEAGQKIGQIVFFKGEPVPDGASYAARGQYNNQLEVIGNLGVR